MIVYGCKSDTVSPARDDDIAMSITCFPETHTTIAVMYGCTDGVVDYTRIFLNRLKSANGMAAFHPLMLPMIFAELERKRLLNSLEEMNTGPEQRILAVEKSLREDEMSKRTTETPDSAVTARDCETTRMWAQTSSLKNGLESFKAQLLSMSDHCHKLSQANLWHGDENTGHQCMDQDVDDRIKGRLKEMVEELNTKVRHCEGILGATVLARQLVNLPNKSTLLCWKWPKLTKPIGMELPFAAASESSQHHGECLKKR